MIINQTTKYKNITKDKAIEITKKINVLILTATDSETETLHKHLEPTDKEGLLKFGIDTQTYYIGKYGNYEVVHVQCKAGSVTTLGSSVTTQQAITLFNPKIILMVGIAFGVDRTKQNIGDVLISETIIPYEIKRVGKTVSINRGGSPKSSLSLYNRFTNHKGWQNDYIVESTGLQSISKVISGGILSGEKLLDNVEEVNKLMEDFPEAIGGEMEGAGLATACETKKIDWILVKAICDFADGDKNNNKKENQKIASESAVRFCKSVFEEMHVFSELGIDDVESEIGLTTTKSVLKVSEVLFKRYTFESERFYYKRDIDDEFSHFLSNYSIWLSGTSGCGKSSIITRNLLQRKYEVIKIFLMSCGDKNILSILHEILVRLNIHFGISSRQEKLSIEEILDAISSLIAENFNNSKKIIYLDEIPEYNDIGVFKSFCNALHVITLKVREINEKIDVIFVLSSIESPLTHLTSDQNKIVEGFKIIKLENWLEAEIFGLAQLISTSLALPFNDEDLEAICMRTAGSPRILKNIFRDYLSTRNLPNYGLERILKEVI